MSENTTPAARRAIEAAEEAVRDALWIVRGNAGRTAQTWEDPDEGPRILGHVVGDVVDYTGRIVLRPAETKHQRDHAISLDGVPARVLSTDEDESTPYLIEMTADDVRVSDSGYDRDEPLVICCKPDEIDDDAPTIAELAARAALAAALDVDEIAELLADHADLVWQEPGEVFECLGCDYQIAGDEVTEDNAYSHQAEAIRAALLGTGAGA